MVGPPPSTSHRPRHGTSKYSSGRYHSVSHVATSGPAQLARLGERLEVTGGRAEAVLEHGQHRHPGLGLHGRQLVHLAEVERGGLLDERRHARAHRLDGERACASAAACRCARGRAARSRRARRHRGRPGRRRTARRTPAPGRGRGRPPRRSRRAVARLFSASAWACAMPPVPMMPTRKGWRGEDIACVSFLVLDGWGVSAGAARDIPGRARRPPGYWLRMTSISAKSWSTASSTVIVPNPSSCPSALNLASTEP